MSLRCTTIFRLRHRWLPSDEDEWVCGRGRLARDHKYWVGSKEKSPALHRAFCF
jgi:hypothetical protein